MFRKANRRSCSRSLPPTSPSLFPPLRPCPRGSSGASVAGVVRIQNRLNLRDRADRPNRVDRCRDWSETEDEDRISNREKSQILDKEMNGIRLESELRIQFAVSRVVRLQSISHPRSSALLMSPSQRPRNKETPSPSPRTFHSRRGHTTRKLLQKATFALFASSTLG